MSQEIAILGAGSWGTALSYLLGFKGFSVRLWARDSAAAAHLQKTRHNPRYLRDVRLPEIVLASGNLSEVLKGASLVIIAVPCSAVGEVMEAAGEFLPRQAIIISASKGLEPKSGCLMSEVIERVLPDFDSSLVVALSGPNLAREMVQEIPTATVVASSSQEAVNVVQKAFTCSYFRIYGSEDVIGVQLGGALKNIYAVGAGISDGLGFGDNTKATLVTRSLTEMVRLGEKRGADPRTFSGLSGVGDLVATCASTHSRNWTVGYRLARGEQLEHILSTMGMVAEGVVSSEAALSLAERLGVEAPILREIYQVLYNGKPPEKAVADLMSREARPELD